MAKQSRQPKLSKRLSYVSSRKLKDVSMSDLEPIALKRIHELESKTKKQAVGRSKVNLKELDAQIQLLKQRVAKNPNDYHAQLEFKRLKANYSSIVSKRKKVANS